MSEQFAPASPIRITKRTPAYWRVTLDNPPINIMGPDMLMGLQIVIEQLEADTEVKVVVFESADPDYFISHYDMVQTKEVPITTVPSGLPPWPDFVTRLTQSSVISIASVRGRARGLGAEFLVACDMSFASRERAILSQLEVGLGFIPGGGGLERLPSLVGRSRALEIVIGSDDFDAETAERYGWINRALPDAELDQFVDVLATRISRFEREAIAEAKALIYRRAGGEPKVEELLESRAIFAKLAASSASQARIATLLEQGLQKRSDTELHLGRVLSDLG
jgi:enoyl-CoA hydratase/carnithine racemase